MTNTLTSFALGFESWLPPTFSANVSGLSFQNHAILTGVGYLCARQPNLRLQVIWILRQQIMPSIFNGPKIFTSLKKNRCLKPSYGEA